MENEDEGSNSTVLLPTGKPNVSYSEIAQWSSCSFAHFLRNVKKIDLDEPNPYSIVGTAIHRGCEHFLRTRKLDTSLATNFIAKHWSDAIEKSRLDRNLPEMQWWLDMSERVLADVPAFMDEQFPGWEFVDAEHKLFEGIDGSDIKFKGFIDALIKVTDAKGRVRYWILDWKTAGWGWRRSKKSDFVVQLQLRLYKHFWSKKTGTSLKDIRCGFVLLKRDGKDGSRCELVAVSMGPTTQERSLKVVNNMIGAVKRGIAVKNRSSCKYCPYAGTEHCP